MQIFFLSLTLALLQGEKFNLPSATICAPKEWRKNFLSNSFWHARATGEYFLHHPTTSSMHSCLLTFQSQKWLYISHTSTKIWLFKPASLPLAKIITKNGKWIVLLSLFPWILKLSLSQDDTTFEKQSALFALAVSDIMLINMWVSFSLFFP